MSEAGDFIDARLRAEGDEWRAEDARERVGAVGLGGLAFTGASVGAVRGTVRDALTKFPGLGHDRVTALSSELWRSAVFEHRLAAVVLLQSRVEMLRGSDLTRIEGFVREAGLRALVDPLASDVLGPLVAGVDADSRGRLLLALERWVGDEPWLRRAAVLALRAPLRAEVVDDVLFDRLSARAARGGDEVPALVDDAVASVRAAVAKHRARR